MTYYEDGFFIHEGNRYRPEELYSPECDIPRLRKHLEWVEGQSQLPPQSRDWRQRVWAELKKDEEGNICGSYRCFAGNVVHEAGGKFEVTRPFSFITDVVLPDDPYPQDIESAAAKLLGLNTRAARLLFHEDNQAEVMRPLCEAIAGERL